MGFTVVLAVPVIFGVAFADGFAVAFPPEIAELPGTIVEVLVVDLILPEILTFGGATGALGRAVGVGLLVTTGAG